MKRVLITFAGGHLGLGVTEALQAAGEPIYLVGTDSSPYHVHLAKTDQYHQTPRADESDFIEALSQIASESDVDLIWPMHDAEVMRVAEAASELPAKTFLPPGEVVFASRNKLETYRRLKVAGVPVPETRLISAPEDLRASLEEFHGELWIRSATGSGGAGALRVSRYNHGAAWFDMRGGWGSFTAAEVLPGPGDFIHDSVWDHGELILGQSQTRLVRGATSISLPGVTSRGVMTCDAPAVVEEIGLAAVRAIAPTPHGIFRVDMFTDADGVPNVTEVDAGRFTTNAAVNWFRLGVNMPSVALKLAFGEPLDFETPLLNSYPQGIISIGGINRSSVFITKEQFERTVSEFEIRKSHSRAD